MKQWFPFTDYDFYGYLACGLVMLFALDIFYTDGRLVSQQNWTVIQATLVVTLGYIVGQMIAMPSSMLLEHGFARTLLRPPAAVLLSSTPSKLEQVIGRYLLGHHYMPFPQGTRDKVYANAEKQTGIPRAQLELNPEEIFLPAITVARRVEDARNRMDSFRNQYGFNRNMAFTCLVASVLLAFHDSADCRTLSLWFFVIGFSLLLRFLKFYSGYAAEVLRTYAFQKVD